MQVNQLIPYTITLAFLLLSSTTALASPSNEVPESMSQATVVNAATVKKMAEGGAMIIDPRTKMEYNEEHIKFVYQGKTIKAHYLKFRDRSRNIIKFDQSKNKLNLKELEEYTDGDKSKKLIFYCNGVSCWKSYKTIIHLHHAGYRNLYWFRGGMPEWKAMGFPTSK